MVSNYDWFCILILIGYSGVSLKRLNQLQTTTFELRVNETWWNWPQFDAFAPVNG